MNKYIKWGSCIVLAPVLLFFILVVLLYIPPIQNWAVRQVTAYVSTKTEWDVAVQRVNLSFPLDLSVEGVKILQQNDSLPQVKDTVADVERMVVDVRLLPLFHQQVEIDALELNHVKFNTVDLVPEARVRGTVARLFIESHGIDLTGEMLKVNTAQLKGANINVALSDTVPPDTSESKNRWKIMAEKLDIADSRITLHTPGDTLQIAAYLGKVAVRNGLFDLLKGAYNVKSLDWTEGQLTCDRRFAPLQAGLDANHLALNDIAIGIDSFAYLAPKLDFSLRSCTFREKSGIRISQLAGRVSIDSTRIALSALQIRTSESSFQARFEMDMNAFAEHHPGKFYARFHGALGKQDLLMFMGSLPKDFRRRYPNYPLTVQGLLKGNLQRIDIVGIHANLPTAFHLRANGYVVHPTTPERLKADVSLDLKTLDIGFATTLLDRSLMQQLRIPRGIGLTALLKADGTRYAATFHANEGGGRLQGTANINTRTMTYNTHLTAHRLPLQHFLPDRALHPFSGYMEVQGKGTDMLSPHTRLTGRARITSFTYDRWKLDGMQANIGLSGGKAQVSVDSHNSLLDGRIDFSALLGRKNVQGTLACDLKKADLYHLRLTEQPLVVSLCAHVDMASDMKEYYRVQGLMSDLTVYEKEKPHRPQDIVLDAMTRRDTTYAKADCGDFHIELNARGEYRRLMKQGNLLWQEVGRQLKARHIDQERFRARLPQAHLYLTAGNDNMFVKMLRRYGCEWQAARINMTSSPVAGLNGDAYIEALTVDSVQLDTVRFNILSDAHGMSYQGQVRNNKKNKQYVFNALFNGALHEKGASLTSRLYDGKGQLGIGIDLAASVEPNGMRLQISDSTAILGYKTFHVNDSNYVYLSDDRRVSANVKLRADDGTGVQVYTNDENHDVLQDITVSLNSFDLEKVMSVIPYTPDMSGVMNGDFHVIQTKTDVSISSAISVKNLSYEKSLMGNVSTEFVYTPRTDGSHAIDGFLYSDGREVGTLSGIYDTKSGGLLNAKLGLNHMPLSMVNGFIPDHLIGFKGYAEGEIDVKGTMSRPQVNGEVLLDSAFMVSEAYGIELRFDDDPVRIVNSHLLFENFNMYAHNDSPLTTYGELDFSNTERMTLDLRMRAANYLLIDAKESTRSEAFGKAFVNFFGRMRGPLDNLSLKGKLDVLGTTDLTYILRDSPLTTDNQLDELVKFTSFADSTALVVDRPPLTGFNMDVSMSIDAGARVLCALNTDKSNYVDLMGGGDLRMQYNVADHIRLTGKYTLNNGEMKYSLPVIPLKTFTIQDGSYIEFSGDPMNPRLNITATEEVKAGVSTDGVSTRMVTFTCGVIITKTLANMGLEFIIDAPEDVALHTELQSMTKEERSKLAVTMLTTGMYLTDGNTNNFTMNSALSAFLNSQINTISGNALRTLDVSFGMDNSTDASGSIHTDYSFKFAKRFWNNRLRIVVGGKVSTGNDVYNQNNTFFDNVAFEYRLGATSNRYVKLFYNRNSYDWLEGNVGEYGGGFIWRRKLQHFRDILRFKSDKQEIPPVEPDTINTKTNEK